MASTNRFARTGASIIALVLLVGTAHAQEMGRFQWKRGQVLQYQVQQTTRATDTTSEGKSELSSRVEQVKRWQVLDVEANGTATVQMSIAKLVMQQRLPSGEVLDYDST